MAHTPTPPSTLLTVIPMQGDPALNNEHHWRPLLDGPTNMSPGPLQMCSAVPGIQGCNTTVIWNSSHSGEAWSGWSDQTHWFQWRPSNVPVVVLQWHPDGVRRGSSDTGADDTALSVTREAPLRPFVHWTSVPMSRSQSACHTQSSWTKSVCMPSVWIQALLLSQLTSVNHDYFKWPQWTLIIHCLL